MQGSRSGEGFYMRRNGRSRRGFYDGLGTGWQIIWSSGDGIGEKKEGCLVIGWEDNEGMICSHGHF